MNKAFNLISLIVSIGLGLFTLADGVVGYKVGTMVIDGEKKDAENHSEEPKKEEEGSTEE